MKQSGARRGDRPRTRREAVLLTVAVAAAALVLAIPASAKRDRDRGGEHEHETEHDAVRDAVARGEIKSLADIIEAVRGKLPGEIVGTQLERKHDKWLYEFRTVDRDGRLFEVYVDAASGEIARIKEK